MVSRFKNVMNEDVVGLKDAEHQKRTIFKNKKDSTSSLTKSSEIELMAKFKLQTFSAWSSRYHKQA